MCEFSGCGQSLPELELDSCILGINDAFHVELD